MGNKIMWTTQASATKYYLHDLSSSYNLVLKEVLVRGRFLKSILCKHDEGLVLVKVYFKRGDSIDLRYYERRLACIRYIFSNLDHSHVLPFQEAKRQPLATRLTGKAILAAAATDSVGCHHDSILSLASVKLSQRLLISSSRDGAIKVWK
ncbi:hypothetical protein Pfo_000370 [Paulownia fortunei]|nr:hypothetical protein Pfo_000370 [Paulownia fortunei]